MCIFTLEPCKNNSCDDNTPKRDDFDIGSEDSTPQNMSPGAGLGDG